MPRELIVATPEMEALLRRMGDPDSTVAIAAQKEFAQALTLPLRQGVLSGDINVFTPTNLVAGAEPRFPLDFVAPGSERDFVAYTIPKVGRLPERHVTGDYVMVPTYDVGNAIDFGLSYARDARWDVARRAMQVLESGFVKKINDDGWHTILAAAVDRNIIVYDADASAGQFTKRLVSLAKTVMRRNGGGNSTSVNRGMLTDLFLSVEAVEDMRSWGVDQVDELTRREIFTSADGAFSRIFSVNIHAVDEFGVGQEYELYFETDLGGTPVSTGSDVEIGVGLDLSSDDAFVMPMKSQLEIFEDPVLHRSRKAGFYGWMEPGFAVLDSRRVLLVSL